MTPDPTPADRLWAAIVLSGIAADVWLDVRGHALLSHRARTPVGRVVQVLLVAHFAGVLPWWVDPFGVVRPISRALRH